MVGIYERQTNSEYEVCMNMTIKGSITDIFASLEGMQLFCFKQT